MQIKSFGYHPEYGLTDEIRLKAINDARILSVKVAADKNSVSTVSIYKWRKRAEQVA